MRLHEVKLHRFIYHSFSVSFCIALFVADMVVVLLHHLCFFCCLMWQTFWSVSSDFSVGCQVVVCHDNNLLRCTGHDVNISDLDYQVTTSACARVCVYVNFRVLPSVLSSVIILVVKLHVCNVSRRELCAACVLHPTFDVGTVKKSCKLSVCVHVCVCTWTFSFLAFCVISVYFKLFLWLVSYSKFLHHSCARLLSLAGHLSASFCHENCFC